MADDNKNNNGTSFLKNESSDNTSHSYEPKEVTISSSIYQSPYTNPSAATQQNTQMPVSRPIAPPARALQPSIPNEKFRLSSESIIEDVDPKVETKYVHVKEIRDGGNPIISFLWKIVSCLGCFLLLLSVIIICIAIFINF